jgi:hypothetical protein
VQPGDFGACLSILHFPNEITRPVSQNGTRCNGLGMAQRSPDEARHPPGTAPFVNRSPPSLQITKMLKCEELFSMRERAAIDD